MESIISNPSTFISAAGLAVTVLFWLVDRFWVRRKCIAYRVHLDTPISLQPNAAWNIADPLEVRWNGEVVPNPSLTLLRIRNAGGLDISSHDIEVPLTFKFDERNVVGFKITEPRPPELRDLISRNQGPQRTEEGGVALPKIPLNKKDQFKLLVLLSGEKKGVTGGGFVRGGQVVRDIDRRGPVTRSLALGGASLALAGILIGQLIAGPRSDPCTPGRLTIAGSTAFAPVVTEISDTYIDGCSAAEIDVVANGSIAGLRQLNSDGRKNSDARSSQWRCPICPP